MMLLQTFDRSVDSLQSKYRELKKLAKKESSEAKRDLVLTGNKRLRSKTVETLRDTNMLLQLRHRMGSPATGFASKHCKYLCKQTNLNSVKKK